MKMQDIFRFFFPFQIFGQLLILDCFMMSILGPVRSHVPMVTFIQGQKLNLGLEKGKQLYPHITKEA